MSALADPDLEQAIVDFEFVAGRIRQIEQQLATVENLVSLRRTAQQQTELADLRESVAGRAKQLQMPAKSLLLIVEQAARMKRTMRRRPTLAQLLNTIRTAHDIADRERDEAAAALILAQGREADATIRLAASAGAVRYLEDCRS